MGGSTTALEEPPHAQSARRAAPNREKKTVEAVAAFGCSQFFPSTIFLQVLFLSLKSFDYKKYFDALWKKHTQKKLMLIFVSSKIKQHKKVEWNWILNQTPLLLLLLLESLEGIFVLSLENTNFQGETKMQITNKNNKKKLWFSLLLFLFFQFRGFRCVAFFSPLEEEEVGGGGERDSPTSSTEWGGKGDGSPFVPGRRSGRTRRSEKMRKKTSLERRKIVQVALLV